MIALLSTLVIAGALFAMIAGVVFTLSDHGSQIMRAWRMEPLPARGDNFRVRQQRQPLVSPTGRIAPDRRAIRRAAA